MTDIPDVVIKRFFDKLDNIDKALHDQGQRISKIESMNRTIELIWKKLLAALGITSTIIGVLVVFF